MAKAGEQLVEVIAQTSDGSEILVVETVLEAASCGTGGGDIVGVDDPVQGALGGSLYRPF
jgi:hypothetical protein